MLVWSIHGYKRQERRHQHPGLCCGCSGSDWSCVHSTNVPPLWRASGLKRRTESNILQFSVANVLRHTPHLTADIFLTVNKHDVQPTVEFSNTVFKDLFHCLCKTKQRLPFFLGGGRAAIIHSQGSGKNRRNEQIHAMDSGSSMPGGSASQTPNCTGSMRRYSHMFPNATWKNI